MSFIETSALDASNVETAFQTMLTSKDSVLSYHMGQGSQCIVTSRHLLDPYRCQERLRAID
jgi:hypothetical protein